MSNEQSAEQTNTVGYFNGNRWPIQLVISRFNCTLHLLPGEFILDKKQRKINDPFFEAYANTKQLKREVSDALVPIIRVPIASNTPPTVPAAQCDGQAVRSVTEWRIDSKGLRQPVIPGPANLPPQSVNKPSVIPMSLAEARARGFIGKQRIVPEDYGLTDTEGTPPSNPPPIKISVDSNMNRGVQPLPKELTEALPGRELMVQQLASASTVDVESGGFLNVVTHHSPPEASSPLQAGVPSSEPLVFPPIAHHSLHPPSPPDVLPEPALDKPPVEEAEEVPAPVPHLPRAAQPQTAQAPKPVTLRDRYICQACGKPFQFRSQLLNHARMTEGHQVETIMAPYPLAQSSS